MSSINVNQANFGQIKTIVKGVDSLLEPVEIFRRLSLQDTTTQNRMLLESSEIESKENVKSILMLAAALRIECNGRQVVLQSLSENGSNALKHIAQMVNYDEQVQESVLAQGDPKGLPKLTIQIAQQQPNLDEDSRLKSASPINILRLIKSAFVANTANEFSLFLCGVFAFDFIATFEQLPEVTDGQNSCPDFVFYLAETLLIIDHQNNSKRLIGNHFSGEEQDKTYFDLSRKFAEFELKINQLGAEENNQIVGIQSDDKNRLTLSGNKNDDSDNDSQNEQVTVNLDDQQFAQLVEKLKANIVQGDIFQVVPSRTYSLNCQSTIEAYRQLKSANPSPYLFYMQDQAFVLFGASPESALKYDSQSNEVLLYPIAGTRPRGKNSRGEIDLDLDARIEAELKLDQKELAEHMMLVDLARNDIARISRPGTTHVPRLLAVDRYSQVMHLVSCVKGLLNPEFDALHAYQACMNMGTLTGAPKIKASELIRRSEQKRRGSYGGAVGYLNGQGDMDTCIVIRSAFCRDNLAYVQAGAGVVFDSDPLMEAKETENKALAVINAIKNANRICQQTGSNIVIKKTQTEGNS
ncbi:anthranilate synthase component 1 [Aliikangiella marina]|uniref:anthranilate synthase n=1 Tax=Aliikangiella marina TaxID=1712262 RepID=A0A545TEC4_9GAMM|nr:anthranilate synthase component 1 [Aliikangiella marina]TQV75573.1 anthranilate synthase component 1 [Aliikangiella marina]